MPRDGAGNYGRTDGTRTGTDVWQQADAAAVNIEPDDHDTHDQDIATALTGSVATDGQSTMTGALKMGSQKITGQADGTAATDGATVNQVQGGAANFATETGAADVYVLSPSPAITSLDTGTVLRWAPVNVNTGASTLNVSALGAVAIVSADGFALSGGELEAGRLVETVYDGTSHVLREIKDTLTLLDTDAGTAQGPVLLLKRVSASPAAGDDLGAIEWYGLDDGSSEQIYARILCNVLDETAGTADGELIFSVADDTGSGPSARFRVRSDEVEITQTQDDALANPKFTLRRQSASPADNDLGGYITNEMRNSAAADIEYGRIQGEAVDVTAATEDGAWTIQTMQGGSLTEMCRITSNMTLTRSGGPPLRVDRLTNDGTLVTFLQDSSVVGDITVSGTTVSYNGYLLTHWSQWGTGLEPDGLVPRGTLLSTVDELVVSADGETDPNHVRVKITSDMACRRVYGVFSGVDADGHVVVDAAGAGLVRVRGPVVGGDLLMASADPGVACVQHDDVWKTHTIGKANMGYNGTGEALLPVALRTS